MGGSPSLPPRPAPPPPPVPETDPAVEAAKQKEITRLAARSTSQSTTRTKSTRGGMLDESDPNLLNTKLGGL